MAAGALYVARSVEAEVLAGLTEGMSCLVLGPPGCGKSSLALHLQARLLEQGMACAYLSLHDAEGQEADRWFLALAQQVARSLRLPDPDAFWRRAQDLTPAQRWQRFVRVEVLSRLFGKVILLLDGLEVVLGRPFLRHDLPGALRSMRDARSMDPTWARLAFCGFGSAEAAELGLGDLARTFLLGHLDAEEAAALLPALPDADARLWLEAVLSWTAGHPGLTVRLWQALCHDPDRPCAPTAAEAAAHLEQLAMRTLCGPGGLADPLLLGIEQRLRPDQPLAGAQLNLYRQLLAQGQLPSRPEDPAQRALAATGLIVEVPVGGEPHIRVRCRLLARLFDEAWAARRQSERLLAARAAAWREHPEDPATLLRGDELIEALRWAEGREDVSAAERGLLLASLQQARREDQQRWEAQQVQQEFQRRQQEAAHRRRQLGILCALLAVMAGLLGTVASLAWSRRAAQRAAAGAHRDLTTLRLHLQGATEDLERERQAHAHTRAQLAQAQQRLAAQEQQLDLVRTALGAKEARLGEVSGRVETIFKKRIATRGGGRGSSTGIHGRLVDSVLREQAWPALRRCFPLAEPPQRLRVQLQVQADGTIGELSHDGPEASACVEQALRSVRFPPLSGAHYVRLAYEFQFRPQGSRPAQP